MRPLRAVRGASDCKAANWGCCRGRGRRGHPGQLRRAGHAGGRAGCALAQPAGRGGAMGTLRS
eukprot:5513651-Alexandrium_andersonii.AAC.1